MMQITPSCAQHIGKREQQQDAFIFSELENVTLVQTKGALAVVADGMGGMEMGQEASLLASRVMLQIYNDAAVQKTPAQILHDGVMQANHEVFQMAAQSGLAHQVGTTLVAVVVKEQMLYWISVGDSAIYLIRNNEIAQLNHEHTYARKLNQDVHSGKLKRAQALFHPERQALTSFVGLSELTEIDANVKPFPLQEGDFILLCSDGLNGTLTEDEIVTLIQQHNNQAPDALVQATLDRALPHQDNVTAVMLHVADANTAVPLSTPKPIIATGLQTGQTTRPTDTVEQKVIQKQTRFHKWFMPVVALLAVASLGYWAWTWFFGSPEGFVYMGKRPDGQTTDIRGYFRNKNRLDEGTLVKNDTQHILHLGDLSQTLSRKWQLIGIVRSEKTGQDHLVLQNTPKDSLSFWYYKDTGFYEQRFAGKYDDFERFEFFRPYTDKNITDPKLLEAVPSKGLDLPQQDFMPRQTQWEAFMEHQQAAKAFFDSLTVKLNTDFNGIKPLKKRLDESEVEQWAALKSTIVGDKRFTLPKETRLDDWRITPLRFADATEAWTLYFAYNEKLDEWTVFAAEKGKPTTVLLPLIQFVNKNEIKLTFSSVPPRVYKVNIETIEVAQILNPN